MSQNIYMMILYKYIWEIFTLFLCKCKKFEHVIQFTLTHDLHAIYTAIDIYTHNIGFLLRGKSPHFRYGSCNLPRELTSYNHKAPQWGGEPYLP
jgi:hypothetical protein